MTTFTVGDIDVAFVHEQELDTEAGRWLMPDLTPELVAEHPDLAPDYVTAEHLLRLDCHSYALEVDGQRIVVDTGVGNSKPRANPIWNDLDSDYLARLAAAGFAPETVDTVVITHLHTDHVGWNTRRDGDAWLPTFPNADYVVARQEWDHWAGVELEPERAVMFADSIWPVRDAGLTRLVDVRPGGLDIAPGVRLLPAPGHTPGQVAVQLTSAGERAIIGGDAIHHPIQVARPELVTRADLDPRATVRTRHELLTGLADDGGLLLGTHFTPSAAGRVGRAGDAFTFEPVAPR